jgi:hypothetical protein
MQMGVEERQDIGHPVPPSEDEASRASRARHMRGLMTSMATDNHLVVEGTMICCGNILTSDDSNPMMTCYSGVDMAQMTGRHCVSVECLETGRVNAAWPLNGNSAELPFQKAESLRRRKDRRWDTTTWVQWETLVVILGMEGSSSHWRSKGCYVGQTCRSNVAQGSWSWVALNWCAASCGS